MAITLAIYLVDLCKCWCFWCAVLWRFRFGNTDIDEIVFLDATFAITKHLDVKDQPVKFMWCYGFAIGFVLRVCRSVWQSMRLYRCVYVCVSFVYWCYKQAQLTKYPQNNDKYSLVKDINNARILNVSSFERYNGPKPIIFVAIERFCWIASARIHPSRIFPYSFDCAHKVFTWKRANWIRRQRANNKHWTRERMQRRATVIEYRLKKFASMKSNNSKWFRNRIIIIAIGSKQKIICWWLHLINRLANIQLCQWRWIRWCDAPF